jgi:tetratricopeptide (TPR) repeat protein
LNLRPLPILRALVVVLVIGILVVAGALLSALLSGGRAATPRTEGERAVMAAEEAVKADPNDGTARIKLAAAYLAQGSASAARNQAEIAVRLQPTEPGPYYVLGLAQAKGGALDEAVVSLKKAAGMQGQQAAFYQDVYVSLARTYEQTGDTKMALEAMGKAIDQGPENVPLLVERAKMLERGGKWYEAAVDYGYALLYTPDYADAVAGLDRIKGGHAEEYKKAVAFIEKETAGDAGAGMQNPFESTTTTGTK